MNINRRSFLSALGAAAAAASCPAAAVKPGQRPDFFWCDLIHFGHKMWGDLPRVPERNGIMTKFLTDAEWEIISRPEHQSLERMHFEERFWGELSAKLLKDGCNTIMLDVGEGLIYPSHPELALKDSWTPERLKAEVDRLRGMGFYVIPKLNFSTTHDEWLGDYARMVSTATYYQVCADVIRDVFDVFGPVKDFHIGFDEEDMPTYQRNTSLMVMRQGELWWHDINWFVREVEKHGARAWVWSDYARRHPMAEFAKKMPRTVVQNPWNYSAKAPFGENKLIQLYSKLTDAGYDVIPCGSNCYGYLDNFPGMAEYCAKALPREHFKGMLMAPWIKTIEPYRRLHWQASDLIAEAIRRARI